MAVAIAMSAIQIGTSMRQPTKRGNNMGDTIQFRDTSRSRLRGAGQAYTDSPADLSGKTREE